MAETTNDNAQFLKGIRRAKKSAWAAVDANRDLFETLNDLQGTLDHIDGPSFTLTCAAGNQIDGVLRDAVSNLNQKLAGDAWDDGPGHNIDPYKVDAADDDVAFSLFADVRLSELDDLFQLLELALNGFPKAELAEVAS